jgi:hypothetical protein
VAAASTRLVVKLVARVPGSGAPAVALGGLTKRASKGTAHLRLTLTPAARRQLSSVSKATLTITISGTSAGAKATSLQRSIVVRA